MHRATKEEDSAQAQGGSDRAVMQDPEPPARARETLTAVPMETINQVAEAARERSPTMTMTTTEHSLSPS